MREKNSRMFDKSILDKINSECKLSCGNDKTKVIHFLREYVFKHIPLASGNTLLDFYDVYRREEGREKGLENLFSLEFNFQGGFFCGGRAATLMELYRQFGYTSDELIVCTDDVNSHAVTIVQSPIDKEYYIQDPTFNQYYTRGDGNEIGMRDILKLLTDRFDSDIILREGDTISCAVSDYDREYINFYPKLATIRVRNGIFISLIDMKRKYYTMDRDMAIKLEERGYPPNPIYSFLCPWDKEFYSRHGII